MPSAERKSETAGLLSFLPHKVNYSFARWNSKNYLQHCSALPLPLLQVGYHSVPSHSPKKERLHRTHKREKEHKNNCLFVGSDDDTRISQFTIVQIDSGQGIKRGRRGFRWMTLMGRETRGGNQIKWGQEESSCKESENWDCHYSQRNKRRSG